uniref:J domain-containing protein n=1 Tax=Opuntia streptacantha TaxID=393608 RepID=A0A7C8ZY51_OPUST
MADHYKVLGVTRNATKEEVKEAFRRLAIQFHPDKHVQSSKSTRDAASLRFKQVSEAYEVLIDDRKRAAYNLGRQSYNNVGNFYSARSGTYGYNNAGYNANYYYRGGGSYYKNWNQTTTSSRSNRWASNLDAVIRLLLAGTVAIDMSGDTLWKMHNTGKSFEDAVVSVQKNKADKDQE